MLYEIIAEIICDMCFRIGYPVTTRRISEMFDDILDADLVSGVCYRMFDEGKLVKVGEDAFTTRSMQRPATVNVLISQEYQALGMVLLPTDQHALVRHIPPQAEHRFLEVRPSTIGHQAGMGLFVRSTRRLPEGCIVCEYRGRPLKSLPRSLEQGVYVVRVKNTQNYIDGVSETGEHLSLATFINDDGPIKANAGMVEYDRHPGRVFVVATRDLSPGEELFVMYGATYWGFSSYAELKQSIAPGRSAVTTTSRGRKRSAADEDAISFADAPHTCRGCGETILRRAARLHREHCGDVLSSKRLHSLEWMARTELTAVDVPSMLLPGQRRRAMRRAQTMVSLSEPQTLSHTHEDVVGDLEFSFEDADRASGGAG